MEKWAKLDYPDYKDVREIEERKADADPVE